MTDPRPFGVVWTYDDLQHMPADGNRYEVVDGELLVTPSPTTTHQTISRRILFILMEKLEHTGQAVVFDAPVDLIVSPTRTVEPDLLVVRRDRTNFVTERGIECAPDLVIEILSPSSARNDREIKRKLYASIGVPEYWLVDPAKRTIEVLTLQEGDLRPHASYGPGHRARAVGFTVEFDIDAIFAR